MKNGFDLKDHASFVMMLMIKNAGAIIKESDLPALYDKAIESHRDNLAILGISFIPPNGFKGATIKAFSLCLPRIEVPR